MEPSRDRLTSAAAALLLAGLLALAPGADPARAAESATPNRPADRKSTAGAAAPAGGMDEVSEDLAWPPGKRGRWGGWWDHYEDSDDQKYDDFSVFGVYKQVYAQVWVGDYTDGVEIGGWLKDGRKSTYGGFYRYRQDYDNVLQLETAQVLGKGFVAVASVRFINVIPDDVEGDQNQFQFGAGFDWYHGDYDFLTFRAISDPREGGRWTFVLSHRFYLNEWCYFEPAIMPRTDGEINWFLRGKVKYFVWLVGDFNQFDFTGVNRKQASIGIEIPF